MNDQLSLRGMIAASSEELLDARFPEVKERLRGLVDRSMPHSVKPGRVYVWTLTLDELPDSRAKKAKKKAKP